MTIFEVISLITLFTNLLIAVIYLVIAILKFIRAK